MDVKLIVFKKDGSGKSLQLPSTVTVIGRKPDCDLYASHKHISRRHCKLVCSEESLKVHDLGSRNGTYINGKRVKETQIQAGDNMKIGPLTFVFQIDGKPEKVKMPQPDSPKPTQKQSPADKLTDEDSDSLDEVDASDSLE